MVFLSSMGPWSAFNVSKISQKERFEKIFQDYGLLIDGKITGETSKINEKDVQQVSSIVDFFDDRKELEYISEYFPKEIDKIIVNDTTRRYGSNSAQILELIGMKYISRWGNSENAHYYFNSGEDSFLDVTGYEHYIDYNYYGYNNSSDEKSFGIYKCSFDQDNKILKISEPARNISEEVEMKDFINELILKFGKSNYNIPRDEMTISKQGDHFNIKIFVKSINLESENKSKKLNSMTARILIKKR